MLTKAQAKICLIIGNPVKHSLSPVMHNTAYKKLKLDNQFVFLGCQVKPADLKKAVQAVRTLNIRGLTCTIPHKTAVISLLDQLDPTAKKIGAVNTVVNRQGKLIGYNTDYLGVITALKKTTAIKNKKVAVLGAGGAARAVVFGLTQKKAKVTIFNRDLNKAKNLSRQAQSEYQPLTNLTLLKHFDIIINATSVGLNSNQSLVPKHLIQPHHVVFDIVYTPHQTKLLKEAQSQGAKIIHGLDMLLYQGTAQFQLYTQKKAPVKTMRQVLIKYLKT